VDIREVEEVLGAFRVLRPPKYVFMTSEPLTDGLYAGLQPKWRSDVIVLGAHATPVTVIHETLHTMGFGETLAYPLAELLARKLELQERFPLIRSLTGVKPRYERAEDWGEFAEAAEKYKGRIELYVRKL
jgi:hypothetical protein